MMEDDFYILLDWDNIGFHELMNRLQNWLLVNEKIQEIEVRASPSLDGYHLYIKTFSFISPALIFELRFQWHDDREKLCMDMRNKVARARGDLFSKKVLLYNGKKYEFKEIKMFKYVRNNVSAEWLKISLRKDYQKKLQVV